MAKTMIKVFLNALKPPKDWKSRVRETGAQVVSQKHHTIQRNSLLYGLFSGLIVAFGILAQQQTLWLLAALASAFLSKLFHGKHQYRVQPDEPTYQRATRLQRYCNCCPRRINYLSFGTGIFLAIALGFITATCRNRANLLPALVALVFAKLCYSTAGQGTSLEQQPKKQNLPTDR